MPKIDCKKDPIQPACLTPDNEAEALPQTSEMVTFLNENQCAVDKNIRWPEIMKKLDSCHLWHKVGPLFDKLGLVFPADPQKIPGAVKKLLDHLKSKVGGWALSCEEAAKIVEDPGSSAELCIQQRGQIIETEELTAEQSFNNCMNGGNPGSCSEVAYRTVAGLLYLRPDCPIDIAFWKHHIEAAPKAGAQVYLKDSIISHGDPYLVTQNLSELVATYYHSKIDSLMEAGRVAEGRELLRQASLLFPDEPKIIAFLAGEYLDKGFNDGNGEMIKEAEKIAAHLEKMGQPVFAYRILRDFARLSNDPNKLEEYAVKLARVDPWDMGVYIDRAFLSQGHSSAIGYLEKAMALANDENKVQEAEKYLQAMQKNIEDTIRSTREKLGKDISELHGRLDMAILYIALKDYSSAEKELSAARLVAATDKDRRDVYPVRIFLLHEQKKYYEIIKLAKEGLSAIGGDYFKNLLAGMYLATDDHDKAKEIYEELAKSSDGTARMDALYGLGVIAGHEPDYSKALEFAKKEVAADPNSASSYLSLATYTMSATGDYKKALEYVDKARDIDPFESQIPGTLSSIYMNALNFSEAMKWGRLNARLSGGDLGHFHDLAFISLYIGDIMAAEEAFLKYIAFDPDHTNAHGGLAMTYYARGDARYKYWLERFMREPHATSDEVFYMMLGCMAELDGNKDKAINYYQLAASIMPGMGPAKARLAALGATPVSRAITDEDRAMATLDAMERIR